MERRMAQKTEDQCIAEAAPNELRNMGISTVHKGHMSIFQLSVSWE
jgi:hypothetical protein